MAKPVPTSRVFIHGLTASCRVGVHHYEKTAPRVVRVDMDMEVADDFGKHGDELAQVVCYDVVSAKARAEMMREHAALLETVAERIAKACLDDERIQAITVRMTKIGSMPDAREAGIEITRRRP